MSTAIASASSVVEAGAGRRVALRWQRRRRPRSRSAPRHPPATGRLDLVEPEQPVGRPPSDPPSGPRRPAPRSSGASAPWLRGRGLPDDDPPGDRLEERARPRLVGPDLALELARPSLGSSRPSSRRSGRVSVASLLGLRPRRDLARPATARGASHEQRRRALARRASSSGASPSVQRPPSPARRSDPCRGPASIRISDTPVSASPARIVAGIGDAPRWRGSSDGWRLSAPCAGRSRIARGTIWP